uniref:Uncharacterized protein n=1 Tax=Candidatus Kentrum sp. MB TaxID=2138164 RepID=A0A450XIM7_9GAMM|nr:MAG: hypothetical protein BECKMB1821G_GA0114241_101346 [Candidatus Kentron sp. MB]VFK29089.1 MAG: hypothetical protein BECKMB1821I_GA0114274_100829 [Candidatus Kentron sp. MB]VFK74670.1 MAG: hypothetical protein BECKMB1821H_GA0114242_100829 [Candidatus Kentron sp. MB]
MPAISASGILGTPLWCIRNALVVYPERASGMHGTPFLIPLRPVLDFRHAPIFLSR